MGCDGGVTCACDAAAVNRLADVFHAFRFALISDVLFGVIKAVKRSVRHRFDSARSLGARECALENDLNTRMVAPASRLGGVFRTAETTCAAVLRSFLIGRDCIIPADRSGVSVAPVRSRYFVLIFTASG